jgi:hypothetical protein
MSMLMMRSHIGDEWLACPEAGKLAMTLLCRDQSLEANGLSVSAP